MKKTRYIVLFVILAIYIFVMYYFLGADNLKKEKYSTTILVGDSTVWNYSDKRWLNITKNSTLKKLDWQEFTVYLDNKKAGNYLLWHDDKWYLFDKNKKAVPTTGSLLAYRSNYDLKIKDFTVTDITEPSYVKQVLEENNLSFSSKLTASSLTSFDIDNDQINEEFYVISNAFADDFNPDTIFSIVFMVKEGKVYYLYNDISPNTTNNGCKPYLNSFIDVDNDNKYEVIVSCGRYSVEKSVEMLYKLTDEGFKILISNQ